MIVWKFGGTSLADAERLRAAAELVRIAESPPVVVASALAGTTVQLETLTADRDAAVRMAVASAVRSRHLEVAHALDAEPGLLAVVEGVLDSLAAVARAGPGADGEERAAWRDSVLATGEDLSTRLLEIALLGAGVRTARVDAREVIRTDSRFGAAAPLVPELRRLARSRLLPVVEEGAAAVVQGFVGATGDGRTTTLGRGGSDFTATLLGAALDADEVVIWTDVDGIFSADPETVSGARLLESIGFEEAVELSHFGARVLHPGAAKHAVAGGLRVSIRNSLRPEAPGTTVLNDRRSATGVEAVAFKGRVVLVRVRARPSAVEYGFLARVFDALARHAVPVDLVSTSHTSTAFTIGEGHDLGAVTEELLEWAEVEIVPDLATVTVVGRGLMEEPGIAARVFAAVGSTTIHLISLASDVSLSILVEAEDASATVARIHGALVASEEARRMEVHS